jgi:quercetin dioxygenase-like cupin family protein
MFHCGYTAIRSREVCGRRTARHPQIGGIMPSSTQTEQPDEAGLGPGAAVPVQELVDYAAGAVVSRTLAKGDAGTLTLFAFDAGEGLSEHSAPFDAWVFVVDGEVQLTIDGQSVTASEGQLVRMPAAVPHAVAAQRRCKFLLAMFKQPGSAG